MDSAPLRTEIGKHVARAKYIQDRYTTWGELATECASQVMFTDPDKDRVAASIASCKFMPGGRYLYYTGRGIAAYNNCYVLKALSDTREDWAELCKKVVSCLMMGGGIGVDFSIYRPHGARLRRTGGYSSGPIDAMRMIDSMGGYIHQGGSRRSAILNMLNWRHKDALEFIKAKDWDSIPVIGTSMTYGEAKRNDYRCKAPLDCTNMSLSYDDEWLKNPMVPTFIEHVKMAIKTGEPGFLFNFGDKSNEILRNACGEITSAEDSDACNLGSINLAELSSIDEFVDLIRTSVRFLMRGRMTVATPYPKVKRVCSENNRIGLGLMGIHEWLLRRGYQYEVVPELHDWLKVYKDVSTYEANKAAAEYGLNSPIGVRAIAPTGTTSIVAGTTSGIEPLFSVAYLRRYLVDDEWVEEKVVDAAAEYIIRTAGVDPDGIQTAYTIPFEDRVKFQADIQAYVDQGISGTINIKGDLDLMDTANIIVKYAPQLRGITMYPDGARGGQPLTPISYKEATKAIGHNTCTIYGKGEC